MNKLSACLLLLFPLATFAQIRGAVNPAPDPAKPQPVRNDVAQPGQEIVTLRNFHIKKGTFDQFLKASQEDVWPYFEKIGARIVGMWQVFDPEAGPGGTSPGKDYDEVYLMTRYASVAHWRATRSPTLLGGNGPDWEKCSRGLEVRRSLTISTSVIFMQGALNNKPYFMPGLKENYEKKP
jgi:hypothetical protein